MRLPRPRLAPPRITPVRIIITAVVALALVIAVTAGAVYAYQQGNAPPEQPIKFPHSKHIQVDNLDCTWCHRTVANAPYASIPSTEMCGFCHKVINPENLPNVSQETRKVLDAVKNNEPINWVRVHRVPDHVHFPHSAHIQAGFQCATCHGNVAEMQVVQQVRDLRMGDCVGCHRENGAPVDCFTCHY